MITFNSLRAARRYAAGFFAPRVVCEAWSPKARGGKYFICTPDTARKRCYKVI